MLNIRTDQLTIIETNAMVHFIDETREYLGKNAPSWVEGKDEGSISKFINTMIKFGSGYGILSEINLQKLMYFKIKYGFEIPLKGYRHEILRRQHFGEDYRMDQFLGVLSNPRELKLITLDSDISLMKGSKT